MNEENKVKTRDERMSELLDKSAIETLNSIKGPSLSDFVAEEPETKEPEVEETQTEGKKIRIPASRLKTLTDRLDALESERNELTTKQAERIAALESKITAPDELPEWWKEAYGDTELSRKGYVNQRRIMQEEMRASLTQMETERAAQEAARQAQIDSIEQSFDDQMDELEESMGRNLTSTQKGELMDIIGEYSPQENGKYIAYISVEKAHEIWRKGQTNDAGKQEMARIADVQSSGATSPAAPTGQPLQWGAWRKRI